MSSRNTFRVLFFLNKSKINNDGAPIMLRITINGQQVASQSMATKSLTLL